MISGFSSISHLSDHRIKINFSVTGNIIGHFPFGDINICYADNPDDVGYPNSPFSFAFAIPPIGAVVDSPNSTVTIEGKTFATYNDGTYEYIVLGVNNDTAVANSTVNNYVYLNGKKMGMYDDYLITYLDTNYNNEPIKNFTCGNKKLAYVTISGNNFIFAKILQ